MHLRGGTAPDGGASATTRLLSADSAAQMQLPQVEVPTYPAGTAC